VKKSELRQMIREMLKEELRHKSLREAEDTAGAVIRTFGRKSYNLADTDELYAWWKAQVEFQMKRYPNRYAGRRGDITGSRLRITLANNLIAKLEAEGVTDQNIFRTLRGIAQGNEWAAEHKETELNKFHDTLEALAYEHIRSEGSSHVDREELCKLIEKTAEDFLNAIGKISHRLYGM
jgi:hypothetical protein